MATTLLGPLLPLLASRWALSDASAGALFTAQFSGQLTATTLSTLITARLGERRTLADWLRAGRHWRWRGWRRAGVVALAGGADLRTGSGLRASGHQHPGGRAGAGARGQRAESGQRVVGCRGHDVAAGRQRAGRRPSSRRDDAAGGGVDGRRRDVGGTAHDRAARDRDRRRRRRRVGRPRSARVSWRPMAG